MAESSRKPGVDLRLVYIVPFLPAAGAPKVVGYMSQKRRRKEKQQSSGILLPVVPLLQR